MYNIHLLPATFGDSILIEYGKDGDPKYILIDGGPYYQFDDIWSALQAAAPAITKIELLVVTHIDIDHIDGIVKMLNQTNLPFTINEVWFNGREQLEQAAKFVGDDSLGSLQGEYLSRLIREKKLPLNVSFGEKPVCIFDYNEKLPEVTLEGGMKITLLGPGVKDLADLIPVWDKELKGRDIEGEWADETRYADMLGEHVDQLMEEEHEPDDSEANRSSIAFLATYKGKTCLFAADSPTENLQRSVQALLDRTGDELLEVDAWKLAHHGSKKSTQDGIMKLISAPVVLVSSDGKRYKHPDEVVIAKLLKYKQGEISFYFNYRTKYNSMWDEAALKEEYGFEVFFPAGATPGVTIQL